MLKRPHTFEDIKGHPHVTEFLKTHIKNNTLPQQIILQGEEGLGKTSFADVLAISLIYGLEDSPEKQKAIHDVIDCNKSNDSIKKYKMSVEGGKEAAKEVLAEFNLALTPTGKKVLILDECHNMSDAAQDVFLSDTEYFPKGLYMILITTETYKLKPTLLSRFFPVPLQRLKQSDMLEILRDEVREKGLNVQGGDSTLTLIAMWADYKPRRALKILDGFADNSAVSSSTIKEFIGYMEVDDVLPIVESLSGSMTFGLTYISEVKISDSILDILIEMLKVKKGTASYKLQFEEAKKVRESISHVSEESLVTLVYELSGYPKVTRQALIHSFMKAHANYARLANSKQEEVLVEEMAQKAALAPPDVKQQSVQAPSFEDMLRSSAIVK